jgi:hypothetical protein
MLNPMAFWTGASEKRVVMFLSTGAYRPTMANAPLILFGLPTRKHRIAWIGIAAGIQRIVMATIGSGEMERVMALFPLVERGGRVMTRMAMIGSGEEDGDGFDPVQG